MSETDDSELYIDDLVDFDTRCGTIPELHLHHHETASSINGVDSASYIDDLDAFSQRAGVDHDPTTYHSRANPARNNGRPAKDGIVVANDAVEQPTVMIPADKGRTEEQQEMFAATKNDSEHVYIPRPPKLGHLKRPLPTMVRKAAKTVSAGQSAKQEPQFVRKLVKRSQNDFSMLPTVSPFAHMMPAPKQPKAKLALIRKPEKRIGDEVDPRKPPSEQPKAQLQPEPSQLLQPARTKPSKQQANKGKPKNDPKPMSIPVLKLERLATSTPPRSVSAPGTHTPPTMAAYDFAEPQAKPGDSAHAEVRASSSATSTSSASSATSIDSQVRPLTLNIVNPCEGYWMSGALPPSTALRRIATHSTIGSVSSSSCSSKRTGPPLSPSSVNNVSNMVCGELPASMLPTTPQSVERHLDGKLAFTSWASEANSNYGREEALLPESPGLVVSTVAPLHQPPSCNSKVASSTISAGAVMSRNGYSTKTTYRAPTVITLSSSDASRSSHRSRLEQRSPRLPNLPHSASQTQPNGNELDHIIERWRKTSSHTHVTPEDAKKLIKQMAGTSPSDVPHDTSSHAGGRASRAISAASALSLSEPPHPADSGDARSNTEPSGATSYPFQREVPMRLHDRSDARTSDSTGTRDMPQLDDPFSPSGDAAVGMSSVCRSPSPRRSRPASEASGDLDDEQAYEGSRMIVADGAVEVEVNGVKRKVVKYGLRSASSSA